MEATIANIGCIVGPKGILLGDHLRQCPALSFGRGYCEAKCIVRPASTQELAQVMRLFHEQRQAVVPWGGQTGLANGTYTAHDQLAISLERMTVIESFEAEYGIMTAQAGVALQTVQETAAAGGWLFPVDLGARGSATIGGNIATNAWEIACCAMA